MKAKRFKYNPNNNLYETQSMKQLITLTKLIQKLKKIPLINLYYKCMDKKPNI